MNERGGAPTRAGIPPLVVLLTLVALLLSTANWMARAYPRQCWRESAQAEPSRIDENERCPDGMCLQIEAFAGTYRGDAVSRGGLLRLMRESHQSSTFLVGAVAGAFTLLGLPAHFSFALLSGIASLLLVAMLWRTCAVELAARQGLALAVTVAFLFHPAALRCLVRPQTDSLVALFLFAGWYLTRRALRSGTNASLAWLAVAQVLAMFVKIHTVSFAVLPTICAWLEGARERLLWRVFVAGTLVPLLAWLALFAGLDLWPSILKAWETKQTFYHNWSVGLVVHNLLPTLVPMLACLFLAGRPAAAEPRAALLLVAFYAAIVVGCGLPPLMRFEFPALAPLFLLTACGVAKRGRRWLAAVFTAAIALPIAITLGLLLVVFYSRYVGPVRDLDPWSSYLYSFF